MKSIFLLLIFLPNTDLDVLDEKINGSIEINHFYDLSGRLVFDQIIFWEFDPETNCDRIKDWRLMKDGRKEYTTEEKIIKENEAKAKCAKEYDVPLKDLENLTFWSPEFGYSKTWIFDHHQKCVTFSDEGTIRKVYFAGSINETWTQYDPELADREMWPKERRTLLRQIHPKASPGFAPFFIDPNPINLHCP